MKNIRNFYNKKHSKLKLFIAIFFATLMIASIFGVLATNNNNNSQSNNNITPDSTNIPSGCSSSVSVGTSYFTNNAVANSSTSTVYLPVVENSSQASSNFSYDMSFSDNNASSSGALITSYYYNGSTINPTFSIPAIYVTGVEDGTNVCSYTIGTVSITVTAPNGDTATYSHAFNDIGADGNKNAWVELTGLITFPTSMSGTFSVAISETNDGAAGISSPTYYLNSGNFNTTAGYYPNGAIPADEPSQSSTGTMYGWHYGSTSTTATIPQYETSYDISWSSNAGTNPVYNSDSQTASSGTFTGSLTDNSITTNPVGDPDIAMRGNMRMNRLMMCLKLNQDRQPD